MSGYFPRSLKQDPTSSGQHVESGIVQLLAHRFGDGLVYLRDEAERAVYARAVGLGLISSEGYVTPAGFHILARHGGD